MEQRRGGLVCAVLALLLASAWPATPARAEELSALGGFTEGDDPGASSYAWGLEYRQRLSQYLDATFSYLNEGHLPDHHRDGFALEVWGRTQLLNERLSLAVGLGPYAYFDTWADPATDPVTVPGFRDYHSVAAIVTGALNYQLSDHWFALLELNQVIAPGDVSTRTVLLGVGYRLDRFIHELDASASDPPDAPNEVGLLFGETVINGLHSDATTAFGAEYRRSVSGHFELSASLVSDSDGLDGRHQAVTGEVWVVQHFFDRQLVVGLGLGSYLSLQSYRTIDDREAASVTGLGSLTLAVKLTRALDLRLIWSRGFTGDDQDRDIVTAGLGWRF
jgi:hypothetical protein